MLFTYACADFYTKLGKNLAFLITQTVFQSKEAGAGFRSFHVRNERNLAITGVEDLSQIQPFPFATNRTAMLVARVGESRTNYPVPYSIWRNKPKKAKKIPADLRLADILHDWVEVEKKQAEAIDGKNGPWMILPTGVSKRTLDKLRYWSLPYRSWKGSDTRGANSVYC